MTIYKFGTETYYSQNSYVSEANHDICVQALNKTKYKYHTLPMTLQSLNMQFIQNRETRAVNRPENGRVADIPGEVIMDLGSLLKEENWVPVEPFDMRRKGKQKGRGMTSRTVPRPVIIRPAVIIRNNSLNCSNVGFKNQLQPSDSVKCGQDASITGQEDIMSPCTGSLSVSTFPKDSNASTKSMDLPFGFSSLCSKLPKFGQKPEIPVGNGSHLQVTIPEGNTEVFGSATSMPTFDSLTL